MAYVIAQDPPINLFDAVMEHRDMIEKYPLLPNYRDMFSVPEFQDEGVLYVVRTVGWNKKDTPNFWVCKGGLHGRPWAGPFKTAAEAEARKNVG